MAYGTIYRVLAIACSLIWLLFEVFRPNNIFITPSKLTLGILAYLVFQICMKITFPDQFTFLNYFQLYIFFLFALMGESFRKRKYAGMQDVLLLIMLLMPIWMITTNIGIATRQTLEGGNVARSLSKSSLEAVELSGDGIGGYGMAYFLIIYTPVLLFLFRNIRRNYKFSFLPTGYFKPLLALNIILGAYTVFKADFVFAILQLLLCFFFMLFYHPTSRKRQFVFFSFLLSGVVVVPLLIIRFINELADLFWGTSLHRKLVDIQLSLVSGKSSGTVYDRTSRYGRSWDYYLENPIFGTLRKDNLGKHSLLLDTLAQYGTFVGLFFAYILVLIFIRTKQQSIFKSNVHLSVGLTFFLTALFNNIGAVIGVAVFLVYPWSVHIIENSISKK